MMFVKVRLVILVLFGFSLSLSAQRFEVKPSSLDFGTQMKFEEDSLEITLLNGSKATVEVTDINKYNSDFFFSGDTALSIDAGDSVKLFLHFRPRHNVEYNTELVVVCDQLGAYRVDVKGTGKYPGTYYTSTFNLSEQALKDALKTQLAKNYVSFGYNGARDWLYMQVDNKKFNGEGASVNTIETAYIGRIVENYTARSDAQTNGNLNTEHTYPQSKFNSSEPMQSDLNHLFVVDASANSRRSNNPFGYVPTPTWQGGGSAYGSSIFEPRDEQKGITARAMLYFVVRYQNYDNFLSYSVPGSDGNLTTQEAVLREWASLFPPTKIDSLRNEKIFSLQKNRNPFIDHPEFLERITSIANNSVAPVVRKLNANVPTVNGVAEKLTFSGTVGDTLIYSLILSSEANETLNLSIATQNGTNLGLASAASLNPGESVELNLKIHRTNGGLESDTLVISAFNMQSVKVPVQVNFFNTGLGDIHSGKVILYPNPAKGRFTIQKEMERDLKMEIYTVDGKLLTSAVLNTPLNEISMKGYPAGLYFVKVIDGEDHKVIRFILE